MPRFFIPPEGVRNGRFRLSGSEAHHAREVLRKKLGDTLDLFDGENASFVGRIDQLDEQEIGGTIIDQTTEASIPFRLVLGQALLKGPKWDWLIEKTCEVGVSEILPLVTERTLIQPKTAIIADKVERWNRIALAASKQCGRADVMRVHAPMDFASALQTLSPKGAHFIPWEKEADRTLPQACAGLTCSQGTLFIGPEGGWAASEIDLARGAGVLPVKLGPTLLRSETAGIVAATLMLREFHIYG